MSFQRPSLSEITQRLYADFVRLLAPVTAVLRRSIVSVMARVMAGASHMMHGHVDWASRQFLPTTSDPENLLQQANMFGFSQEVPTFMIATIQISGTPDGTTAPSGSVLSNAGGFEFTTGADATLSSGVATVDVTAEIAGADSTLGVGDTLTFQSPIAGIDAQATVTAVVQSAVDQEAVEALRSRFLEFLADPPQGGSDADYVIWAKEVPGVTRVWPYPKALGPGTVAVVFVRDNDPVTPIPDSGEIAAVQTQLDLLKPAHATVTALAPTLAPLALVFSAMNPNTQVAKDAVTAGYADFMTRTSIPGSTTKLEGIRTAIGDALEQFRSDSVTPDFTLTSPSGDTTHTAYQLPSAGNITFP